MALERAFKMREKVDMQKFSSLDVLLGRPPSKYRERYRDECAGTNVSRMYFLSTYIIIIQIILNIINIIKPEDTKNTNINIYIFLSLFTLTIGIIFLILSLLCRKEKIKNTHVQQGLAYTLLYVYFIVQMTFFTLNIQMDTGGINSYVIGLIIASLVFIVKPLQTITIVVASLLYTVFMMFHLQGKNDVWQSVMLTDTWANLLIITALILLVAVRMYYMYMSDFMSRMKLEESIEHANLIARKDSLTDLLNRRGFFSLLNDKKSEMMAAGVLPCMAIFDIDFFKKYNDKFGHLAGDECLCGVAKALRTYFDSHDSIVCRFGGEEFLAFFAANGEEEAREIVTGARKSVEKLKITGIGEIPDMPYVTISAGYIIADTVETDGDELIHKADMALYESKRNGRNVETRYHERMVGNARHVRGHRVKAGENFHGQEKRGKK